MQEQVISKETAILAKEEGFNWETFYYYNSTNNPREPYLENGSSTDTDFTVNLTDLLENHNKYGDNYSAPTQSLLAKWLREIHNIHVTVEYISTIKTYIALIRSYDPYIACSLGIWKNYNYEQALEKGLNYALEYLKPINNNDIP